MPMPLKNSSKVEKAIDTLRAMGLSVQLYPESDDLVFLFISLDSLMRIIDKRINYPNKKLSLEEGFLVIKLWR